MVLSELKSRPIWQMTGEEFLFLQQQANSHHEEKTISEQASNLKYVYGYKGIAELFGCSIPTAARIKLSGKIDGAITQIGRKLIIDSAKALELAGRKDGGRR